VLEAVDLDEALAWGPQSRRRLPGSGRSTPVQLTGPSHYFILSDLMMGRSRGKRGSLCCWSTHCQGAFLRGLRPWCQPGNESFAFAADRDHHEM